MQDQHTQEPVAEVCATSYRANDGDVHTRIEIRRLQSVNVGTLLYAFPPDAAAHITELVKQRDTLLAALNEINNWLVCACIATPEDMAQSFPHMQQVADTAIANVKEQS